MDNSELTTFATRYAAAWSGQDPAAFASYYADCRQMYESKPWVSHPLPTEESPDQNQCQAEDYEYDEQDMTEEKQIGG